VIIIKSFTIRKKVINAESLHSILHRTAATNGISFIQLLNLVRKNKYRLHMGDVHRLDYCPTNVIDIEKLSFLTRLPKPAIMKASFYNVINTFRGESKEENCMFLNGLLLETLQFCPDCYKERKNNLIYWKIKDIVICHKHSRFLEPRCQHCKRVILYKNIIEVGYCPYCVGDLGEIDKINSSSEKLCAVEQEQAWLYQNWRYLINCFKYRFQSWEIALRLLFIVNNKNIELSKQIIREKIKESSFLHFLQSARRTTKKRTIRIQTLLSILYTEQVEVEEFLKINLPKQFIDSVRQSFRIELKPYCLAPWCSSYEQDKSLIQTATKNTNKGGKPLKDYMICRGCGCEYAFDSKYQLVERSYFIKAYNILINRSITKLTWPEREKLMGSKRNRIRRVMAYFNSRSLFLDQEKIFKKKELDRELLEKVISAVRHGESIYDIQHWVCWNNDDHYLLHRYHLETIEAICEQNYCQLKDSNNCQDFLSLIHETCNRMLESNQSITLPTVAMRIGVSATTIQNKGCSKVVAKYKKLQQTNQAKELKLRIIKTVEDFFEGHPERVIYSREIYERLEVCRATLKKADPQLCKKIDLHRIQWNKDISKISSQIALPTSDANSL
jgi:hypothetical protein